MVKLGDIGPEIVDIIYEKLREEDEKNEELFLLQSKGKNQNKKKAKRKRLDLRMHEWLGMAQRKKLYRELVDKKNINLGNDQETNFFSYFSQPSSSYLSFDLLASADTSFFVGYPLMSTSFFIVFVIILNSRIKSRYIMFYIIFFIFNINPIYVNFFTFLYILYLIYSFLLSKVTNNKHKKLIENSFSLEENTQSPQQVYDYIFVASDYSSLYAANLVIKEKREDKCLVLLLDNFNEEVELIDGQGRFCRVNTNQGLVDNLFTYQHLLDLVLLNDSKDLQAPELIDQYRVLLYPLGSPDYGYSHSVIQFSEESPFNNFKKISSNKSKYINNQILPQEQYPYIHEDDEPDFQRLPQIKEGISNDFIPVSSFVCRIGRKSFINEFSSFLSLPFNFVNELVEKTSKLINPLTDYYLKDRINNVQNIKISDPPSVDSPQYLLSTSLVDYLKTFTSSISLESLASLTSIINCLGGSTTSLTDSSFLSLSHLISRVQHGLYSPENGMCDLKEKLINRFKDRGGVVMENVEFKCFEFEELELSKNKLLNQKYKLNGITINSLDSKTYLARKGVICGLPLLSTLSLLPNDSFSEKTKDIISGLAEARPILKVVLIYKNDKNIKVNPINYYQVNPYVYLEGSHLDVNVSPNSEEVLAQSYVKVWTPIQKNDSTSIIFVLEFELSNNNILKENLSLFNDNIHLNPIVFYDKTNPKSKEYENNLLSSKLKFSQKDKNLYLNYSTNLITKLYPILTQDSLVSNEFILPYIGKQKIKKSTETLKKIQDFSLLSDDINNLVYCHSDFAQNDLLSEIQVGYSIANLLIK